jgi:hypothetical protein
MVTTFVEVIVSYPNPLFTDLLGPLLVEQPSTRLLDAYSSYHLPSSSPNRLSSDYIDGILIPPMDPEITTLAHITTTGASNSLLGTSVTQVTPTQPLTITFLSAHGSGNILASLIPHMQTPIDLIGYPISMMSNNQVVQTTAFKQATQPTYLTLQMGSSPIPFVRG